MANFSNHATGSKAVDELMLFLNAMSQDDATGEIVALVREGSRLVQRNIDLDNALTPKAVVDALIAARCELLILDGGNTHGDTWKFIFHAASETGTFVRDDAPTNEPDDPRPGF
jgi:hypothetical protein